MNRSNPVRRRKWVSTLMLTGFATGCFFAALMMGGTAPASAADLAYTDPDYGRRAPAYTDPRYGDVYRIPRRRPYAAAPRRRYEPPSYKDDFDDVRPRTRFRDPLPRRRFSRVCTPRRLISRRLRRDGWFDFQVVRRLRDTAVVRARNENGGVYRLRLDRCTGRVLNARLIRRRFGRLDRFVR